MSLRMSFAHQEWCYRQPFRFAREARESSSLFVVYLSDGEHMGRGECGLQSLKNETVDSVSRTLADIRDGITEIATREHLNRRVGASSARNAVDCAFWDLECKRAHASIWALTGLTVRDQIEVDITVGLANTDKMAADAAAAIKRGYGILKIKADATNAIAAVEAIHAAAPDASLVVDANESWSLAQLEGLAPRLRTMNVCLIEQPLHHDKDEVLADYDSPIPLCADESCATRCGLDDLAARYDVINIKLDKAGGLSEALALAREARTRDLGLMVGCNGATSLGIAPAYVVGTLCDWRDLDSPELLIDDRADGMQYDGGMLKRFDSRLWG